MAQDKLANLWYAEMVAKGHKPKMYDYENGEGPQIDTFAHSFDFCNGPACETCGWSTCMWCNSKRNIPLCSSSLSD